jgi:hypothetical protein
MGNDLAELMRSSADDAPPGDVDVASVVATGRRRVRRRRGLVGATALATAAVVTGAATLAWTGAGSGVDDDRLTANPPRPDAPTIRLSDAEPAVEGRDYEELTSYTNEDLEADNGQYLDGVTDDGLVLFRDGPRADQRYPRFALLDPATGDKDWLPRLDIDQTQTWPVELSSDRLVLAGMGAPTSEDGLHVAQLAYVFDRASRTWRTMSWPELPGVELPSGDVGPDGRLYVTTPDTQGAIPEGGWPVGTDGEAEDADAEGDTFRLWSVSLTDADDVRDEGLVVGDVAFTDDAMVWTDSSNGDAGQVHVRDLATGEETSFDPRTGERCNLLGLGASGDRIVLSQYCGTYADGVRDDRVQILSTDGEQVVTIQDSGAEGWLPAGSEVVNLTVYGGEHGGTYAYDLAGGRFLRLSEDVSSYGLGGPTGQPRELMWHTPENRGRGATQHLGRLLD